MKLNTCYQAIYQLVCVGTHFLEWEIKSETGEGPEKTVVLIFFRRVLQLLDAIAIQMREGAVDTCEIHMRSLIEVTMAFVYLTKEDTTNRSLKYLFCEYHRKKKLYERYNPEFNPKYSELQDMYRESGFLVKDIIPIPNSAEKIEECEAKINDARFNPFREDFNQKRRQSNLKWYNLGTQLSNVSELAKEVGLFELYDIVYQQYNNSIHGTDLMVGAFEYDPNDEENIYVTHLRNPNAVNEITMLAIQIGTIAFRDLVKRFTYDQKEEASFRMGRYGKQHTGNLFNAERLRTYF